MKQQRITMTDKNREKNQPYDIDTIPEEVHVTKTARWINKTAVIALVVIAIGIGVFLNWSFTSEQPLVINNNPFPTRAIPPDAGPNDVLVLEIDYCKNTEKQGEVRTSFVSESREIFLPVVSEQYDEGCFFQDIPILIPEELPVGTYHIHFEATYDLNPIKKNVTIMFQSQKFTVGPNSGVVLPSEQ